MQIKEKVKALLEGHRFDEILEISDRPLRLTRTLMGFLYHEKQAIRVASSYTLGIITQKIYFVDQEKVKQMLQKLLWSLNDESGFICWGAPEAIGEIVRNIPDLSPVYAQFLISMLSHPQVILNNNTLEKGSLIALSRIGKIQEQLKNQLTPILIKYLEDSDNEIRELALWCGYKSSVHKVMKIAGKYFDNTSKIGVYEDGKKVIIPLSDILN